MHSRLEANLCQQFPQDRAAEAVQSLENLARYICDELAAVGPISRVTIYRDSCGESCTYRPGRG